MKRTHVDSSEIDSVGYDPTRQLLEIEFCSTPNFVYQYVGIPRRDFDNLLTATSTIDYFRDLIKPYFPVEQVPVTVAES